MNKAIIIGCPGSGKTTFAEKLQKCTGLPLYYLDAIWHKPDKTHIPREEFDERIKEIFITPEWIIDGNYSRTIEMRMQEWARPIRMFFERYGVTPVGVAPFFSLLSYNAVFLRILSCFFHHSNYFFLCRNTYHSDSCKINIHLHKTMTA